MSDEWIAVRLAHLWADRRGRLNGTVVLQNHTARIALVVDLTLRGRWQAGVDDSSIDTTPTGFGPADAILAHVATHPGESLQRLLFSAPVRLRDAVDWPARPRRRYPITRDVRLDPLAVGREWARLEEIEAGRAVCDPATAALAVLAGAAGLTPDEQRPALLAQCGDAQPVLTDCARYLDRLLDKLALVSTRFSGG